MGGWLYKNYFDSRPREARCVGQWDDMDGARLDTETETVAFGWVLDRSLGGGGVTTTDSRRGVGNCHFGYFLLTAAGWQRTLTSAR